MAAQPIFAAQPDAQVVTISTANTARDGSGTMGVVFVAGPSGSRIDQIFINATATTTAGLVKLYISRTSDVNTTANTHLIQEIPVTAVTPSATVAAFARVLNSSVNVDLLPIFLPAGYTLRADTTIANAFRVMAIGGDF